MKRNVRLLATLAAVALCVSGLPGTWMVATAAPWTYVDTGYFGDGSDGDLYIAAGNTVSLPVPIPHQSVVVMNYKSITIEAGGTLTTDAPNAGLVLKVTGNVTINGTIDQTGKAPKSNPLNTYPYPPQMMGGAGGTGGAGGHQQQWDGSYLGGGPGGAGQAGRPYGGGYSGGGGGGGGNNVDHSYLGGGSGGSAANITVSTPMFVGGSGGLAYSSPAPSGTYGGGGQGGGNVSLGPGGVGGNSPGAVGVPGTGGGGGGAGNMGGGAIILYVGGNLRIVGSINCLGTSGGKGGGAHAYPGYYMSGGGGGGGAGGGSVYAEYAGTYSITGNINVDGGAGGAGGAKGGSSSGCNDGNGGTAGARGVAHVQRVPDLIPPIIHSATASTTWSTTNTITVSATDALSGVAGYALTTSNSRPSTGWQVGNTFTVSANGTYYAWAKDGLGNVSVATTVPVSFVDLTAPQVVSATVAPTGWSNTNKTITATATDAQSGVVSYSITATTAAPTVWLPGNTFVQPAGTYYLWAKDAVGNVSAYFSTAVTQIDTQAPAVIAVSVQETWGLSNDIVVAATDSGGSGVKDFAVSTAAAAPSGGWQGHGSFTLPSNGTYYAFTRDNAGNVSGAFRFVVNRVDKDNPMVTSVDIPFPWATSSNVTIKATDVGSGVKEYAVTTTTAAPVDGWQSTTIFALTANGTYYAWARDAVGNLSAAKSFVVSRIDHNAPQLTRVELSDAWAITGKATLYGLDAESGIKDYAVTSDDTPPVLGWQSSNVFTVSANGTYYAWARDAVGNLSTAKSFVVTKVDRNAPQLTQVELSEVWATTGKATIHGLDAESGIKDYAVTSDNTPPALGWQSSNVFTVAANGTYYAWIRDVAGNISTEHSFTVSRVDTTKPVIAGVEQSKDWADALAVEIVATDVGSGVKEYAISSYSFVPSTGWQPDTTFTLVSNGSYFAFARDHAGNASEAFKFTVDRIDKDKPVVEMVSISPDWATTSNISIKATDVGSGVKDYAVTTAATAPTEGWQISPDFVLESNGSYYAWARDSIGNVSAGRYFIVLKVDRTTPTIDNIAYNATNTVMMVRGKDTGSGVKGIYLDGALLEGANVSLDLAPGTRYVRVQVVDNAGNLSEEVVERIPGWYDELASITIQPVAFTDGNQKALITATSTGAAVEGIHVNNKYYTENPVTLRIAAGTEYLEMQAQDVNGDRSALYRVRVPGWSSEVTTLSIVDVRFSTDNTMAQITAMETGGRGVRGIRVNGQLLAGNPVQYTIPPGTKHLEMQAEDNEGDRSAVLIRRVPGWSDVVTTLTITDVSFTDANTTAKITATATGGDAVAGIEVNGQLLEGNPVVYKIPRGTELLQIQALNMVGDRSPMLNKQVPKDVSKGTLKISIEPPSWTSADRAKVKITVADQSRISQVLARAAEEDDWADVTSQRYIYITSDTTVYASVENEKGETRDAEMVIACFDRVAPKVTATQDGNVVNIRATDDKSGVATILVNNKEYKGDTIFGGKLAYTIPSNTTRITIFAEDAAGNLSQAVDLPLQTTVTAMPVIVAPEPKPTPPPAQPEEVAIPEPPPASVPEVVEEVEPEPEPEPLPPPAPPAVSPAVQAAVAVGGVGSAAAGGLWYWLRRRRQEKPVEELEMLGKKLLYDESEYGGALDPLDQNWEE